MNDKFFDVVTSSAQTSAQNMHNHNIIFAANTSANENMIVALASDFVGGVACGGFMTSEAKE